MAIPRPASSLRAALLRPVASPVSRPALPIATQRFAHSGYGDGKGDPVGENPQKQPPAKSRDIEHPGPPPPDVGKGTDATAAKDAGKGRKSESPSSGSQQSSHSIKGAEPKILNANPPAEESPEVRQHNKEMENRAERAATKISNEDAEKDKVPPGFWSGGHGGTKGQ
ncbi:Conserved serine-rich protein [Neofusicoccum parvum]|nr:Conserved serine-rich protein [Neofusicoccum parvum]